MAKNTDMIRVDRRFARQLKKISEETGESMVSITAKIPIKGKKKRRPGDPFDITTVV